MPCTPAIRCRLKLSAVATTAALASVGLALLPSADAGFTDETVDAGSSLGAADYFTCTAAVTNDAPAVRYRFDETSGTVARNSAQGDDGTYQGTTTVALRAQTLRARQPSADER